MFNSCDISHPSPRMSNEKTHRPSLATVIPNPVTPPSFAQTSNHPLSSLRPVTRLPNQLPQPLQPHLIHLIKPSHNRTVNINNGHHLAPHHNRDDNLTPARPVTRDVPRELVDVGNNLRLLCRCSCPAHAPPEGDGLACYLALEGREDELRAGGGGGRVEGVEACGLELAVGGWMGDEWDGGPGGGGRESRADGKG